MTTTDDEQWKLLSVYTGESYDMKETFEGRWLVAPDLDETRAGPSDQPSGGGMYDAGAYWGIAQGKNGHFGIYSAHCNERFPGAFSIFDTFDEAIEDMPQSLVAIARSELTGEPPVLHHEGF